MLWYIQVPSKCSEGDIFHVYRGEFLARITIYVYKWEIIHVTSDSHSITTSDWNRKSLNELHLTGLLALNHCIPLDLTVRLQVETHKMMVRFSTMISQESVDFLLHRSVFSPHGRISLHAVVKCVLSPL